MTSSENVNVAALGRHFYLEGIAFAQENFDVEEAEAAAVLFATLPEEKLGRFLQFVAAYMQSNRVRQPATPPAA